MSAIQDVNRMVTGVADATCETTGAMATGMKAANVGAGTLLNLAQDNHEYVTLKSKLETDQKIQILKEQYPDQAASA